MHTCDNKSRQDAADMKTNQTPNTEQGRNLGRSL